MPDQQSGGRKRKRSGIRFARNLTQHDIPAATVLARGPAGRTDMSPLVDVEDDRRDRNRKIEASSSLLSYGLIELQEQRYRDWRKHGSPHDRCCFVCGKLDNLQDCYTCRRAYGLTCLTAPVSKHFWDGKFYCELCFERQWHVNPPPLTPPASPPPDAASQRRVGPEVYEGAITSSQSLSTRPAEVMTGRVATDTQQTNYRFISSELQDWDKSGRSDRDAVPAPSPDTPTILASLHQNLDSLRETSAFPPPTPGSNSRAQGQPSRFSTLTPEVDNAITVILRDLEYSAAYRRQCNELESLVLKLQQEAEIRKNDILLAQRATATDNERNANCRAEIVELKAKIDTMGQEIRVKDDLIRDSHSELERLNMEVEKWKADASTKEKELLEWKDKLKRLVS